MSCKRVFAIAAVSLVSLFCVACLVRNRQQSDIHPRSIRKPENKATSDLPPFTFEDLSDNKFSYSSFYPSWVSPSEYIYRDGEGIKIENLDDGSVNVIVPNSFYQQTDGAGWSLSNDLKFLLVRTSYFKGWRHSYNGSYAVYDITNPVPLLELTDDNVQYMRWSPTDHALVWVKENDLYYLPNATLGNAGVIRLTNNGAQNRILNGIPDWVYEEEMVFSTNNIFWSPDSKYISYVITDDTNVELIEFSRYDKRQYPKMMKVAYPKAGTVNPKVTVVVYNTVSNRNDDIVVEAPTDLIGVDHLFSRLYWYPDSKAFLIYWMNRISNIAVPQLCEVDTGSCRVIQAAIEESTTGWIGNGGVPFRPRLFDNSDRSFFTIFSNEGYWHLAHVDLTSNTRSFLTTGSHVLTSLDAYDEANGWLYFRAAYPKPRNRLLYRVNVNSNTPVAEDEWECMTCNLDQSRCQWVTPSFSPTLKYVVYNCGGLDVPMSTLQLVDSSGNYGEPEVVYNNSDLIENKQTVKWPTKEYGELQSTSGITILYQLFKPIDFDENKKYPLLIEVYGGPGYQKVQDRWSVSWASTHMVSQYEVIVASLDARGSGYRGDDIMHMLYKKIGQLEKKDTTEVAQHLASKPWIDETRVAVWGWSYGGYTTTFTISEGSGVFKCGFAVAPLATRYLYDSIHTERYMTMPDDNVDGYEKCSILNSNLQNFKKAQYFIIHGTADDNVHFQNAALITKALVEADVDFGDFYYADEAHSINSGPNANDHIYKQLTRRVRQCFNLPKPEIQKKTPYAKPFVDHDVGKEAKTSVVFYDEIRDTSADDEGRM